MKLGYRLYIYVGYYFDILLSNQCISSKMSRDQGIGSQSLSRKSCEKFVSKP